MTIWYYKRQKGIGLFKCTVYTKDLRRSSHLWIKPQVFFIVVMSIIVPEKEQALRSPQYCIIIHKIISMTIKAISNTPETCMYDLCQVLKGLSHNFSNVVLIVCFIWITWCSLSASRLLPCPDFIPNLFFCISAPMFLTPLVSQSCSLIPDHPMSTHLYAHISACCSFYGSSRASKVCNNWALDCSTVHTFHFY